MDQIKGSLRFSPLPALTQFIGALGSTGRLKITQGAWTGEIALREGQIVGAQLGVDKGRAALEGMVLALTEADFAFIDGVVQDSAAAVLGRDELARFMAALVAERDALHLGANALSSVPTLIAQEQSDAEAAQVTIKATALLLIPSLVYGHTLEQIAQRRGLARTLREIDMLVAGGLVRLEATRTHAPAAPQAVAPVRPVRPVQAAAQAPQPRPVPAGVAHHVNAFQSAAAVSTATVELPRPRLVREPELAPIHEEEEALEVPPRGGSWRSAVRGFFIAEAKSGPSA